VLDPPFYNSIEEYHMNWKKSLPFSFIEHSRDKEGDFGVRVVLHVPIGLLIGLTFPLSIPLVMLFIRYEENEDVHTKDQAWKDYFGALVGCSIGIIAVAVTVLCIVL